MTAIGTARGRSRTATSHATKELAIFATRLCLADVGGDRTGAFLATSASLRIHRERPQQQKLNLVMLRGEPMPTPFSPCVLPNILVWQGYITVGATIASSFGTNFGRRVGANVGRGVGPNRHGWGYVDRNGEESPNRA